VTCGRHVNIGPQYQADLAAVAGIWTHVYKFVYFCCILCSCCYFVDWSVTHLIRMCLCSEGHVVIVVKTRLNVHVCCNTV